MSVLTRSEMPLRVALLEVRTDLLARVHAAERRAINKEELRDRAGAMREMLEAFDRALDRVAPPKETT